MGGAVWQPDVLVWVIPAENERKIGFAPMNASGAATADAAAPVTRHAVPRHAVPPGAGAGAGAGAGGGGGAAAGGGGPDTGSDAGGAGTDTGTGACAGAAGGAAGGTAGAGSDTAGCRAGVDAVVLPSATESASACAATCCTPATAVPAAVAPGAPGQDVAPWEFEEATISLLVIRCQCFATNKVDAAKASGVEPGGDLDDGAVDPASHSVPMAASSAPTSSPAEGMKRKASADAVGAGIRRTKPRTGGYSPTR